MESKNSHALPTCAPKGRASPTFGGWLRNINKCDAPRPNHTAPVRPLKPLLWSAPRFGHRLARPKPAPTLADVFAALNWPQLAGAGGGHFSFCWFFCWFFLKKQRFYIGGFESDNHHKFQKPSNFFEGFFYAHTPQILEDNASACDRWWLALKQATGTAARWSWSGNVGIYLSPYRPGKARTVALTSQPGRTPDRRPSAAS